MLKKIKDRSILAQNVIMRRAALGLNQEAFADLAGIALTSLKNIERGAAQGHPKTRNAIAKALGCSVSDLFKDEKNESSQSYDNNLNPEESARAELLYFCSRLPGRDLNEALSILKRLYPNWK